MELFVRPEYSQSVTFQLGVGFNVCRKQQSDKSNFNFWRFFFILIFDCHEYNCKVLDFVEAPFAK